MNEYVGQLVARYRARGILLDAGVLLLYFVGAVDKALVPTVRKLKSRNLLADDYDTLCRLLEMFKRHVTTPNALTEVCNLADDVKGERGRAVFTKMREQIGLLDERHVPSAKAAGHDAFLTLGLSDAALLTVASEKLLLLTLDFPLAGYCRKIGGASLTFDSVRSLAW
jgi:hypothetical protein